MSKLLPFLALVVALGLCVAQTKRETTTMTGVIDQVESEYFLTTADDMKPIAVLQGVGFHKDNFARFVGMPVQVRGTMITGKDRKILQVRSISDIKPVKQSP